IAAVAAAALADGRAARDVAVLEQVERLRDTAGAEVDGEHEFGTHLVEPRGELVQAHLVGLGRVPGEVEAARALLARAHRVLPAEARDEVAAGVADGAHAELLDELDDVVTESVGIRARVARLVDARVDVSPEVLDKPSEETAVDHADRVRGV